MSSKCIFYEGEYLAYTGIIDHDTLTVALQKIDAAIGAGSGGGGTVTSFSFTDTAEVSGNVVTSTTTPNLTITLILIDGGTF